MHEELKRSHINAKEEQHDKLVDHHKKAISRVDAVQVYQRQLRVLFSTEATTRDISRVNAVQV